MTRQTSYRSVFAPYFNSFLNMKEQLGFGLNKFQDVLHELDRFLWQQVPPNFTLLANKLSHGIKHG